MARSSLFRVHFVVMFSMSRRLPTEGWNLRDASPTFILHPSRASLRYASFLPFEFSTFGADKCVLIEVTHGKCELSEVVLSPLVIELFVLPLVTVWS